MIVTETLIKFLKAKAAGLNPILTKILPGVATVSIPVFDPTTGERQPDDVVQVTTAQITSDINQLQSMIDDRNDTIAKMQAMINKLNAAKALIA